MVSCFNLFFPSPARRPMWLFRSLVFFFYLFIFFLGYSTVESLIVLDFRILGVCYSSANKSSDGSEVDKHTMTP